MSEIFVNEDNDVDIIRTILILQNVLNTDINVNVQDIGDMGMASYKVSSASRLSYVMDVPDVQANDTVQVLKIVKGIENVLANAREAIEDGVLHSSD